jgi:DNA polymerase III subunit delta
MSVHTFKDLSKILAEIEKGLPVPVYLIYGDAYLVQDVYQQLVTMLLPEEIRSFNLEIADGEKEDIHSILERIQTFPFLPGPKVVVVKNSDSLFNAANEDLLWKKAEAAWEKGQTERCVRLLQTLLPTTGPSSKDMKKEDKETVRGENPSNKGVLWPEWVREALIQFRDRLDAEPGTSTPDQHLESAIRTGLPKNHILIFLLEGLPDSKKFIKFISENGRVLNLSLRQSKKGEQTLTLKGYLKSRLSREGKNIQPQAEAVLLERVAPEVFLLEMEIQKLCSYLGDRTQITAKDVLDLVGSNREEPLYELTAVLGKGEVEEGLRKLEQLSDQGYNPLQILAGITNTLRRLVLAKELLEDISGTSPRAWQDFGIFSAKVLPRLKQLPLPELFSKTHPYVLFNTLKTAQNFSVSHLVSALENLQEIDRLLKTSGATPHFLLEDFIFSFGKN